MTRLTMEAAALAKVLGDVKDVASRDSAQPLLGCVLVQVRDGTLTARTTNHELEIVRMIPLDADPVAFCVDARRLAAVVSAMQSGSQVAITVGDGSVTVAAERSRFRLGALNPEGFPTIPFTGEQSFDVGADFFEAIATARPSCAVSGIAQYWLSGVFVGDRDGSTWIAATDGNQLTTVSLPAMNVAEMILASSTVDFAMKIGRECRMSVEPGKVRLDFGSTVITAKLIEGSYPQFARVIPGDTPIKVEFDGDDLRDALARITLVTEDKDRTVSVAIADERMTVSNRSAGTADQGVEEVPCDYRGKPFEGAFRLAYLRAALAAVDADTAVWSLTDAAAPTKITNPARPAITAVVMPTR